MENLRERRLKTINAYKLGLKKVYEELLNDLGKLYSHGLQPAQQGLVQGHELGRGPAGHL